MRRVLAVLPLDPHPPDQGDRLRAWEMLQALAEPGGLTVVVVAPHPPAAATHAALAEVGAELRWEPLPRAGLAARAALAVATGRPPGICAYWDPALRRRFAAEREPWDAVVAFQLRAAPYALGAPARVRALELTDALGLYRRGLPLRGRAWRARLALRGVERLERVWPPRFGHVWISAQADADWIAGLSGRRPTVVPNGCRALAQPAPYRADGPVLFVGNMRYPPNEDAALWFAGRVWPEVRRAGDRLRLVGRETPAVRRLAAVPGVEVAGFVPDVAAEFARASVVVNPVRFGGGSNRKVLDAWAAARPVLSTRVGARGLPGVVGEHLLCADAVGEWRERLAQFRADPEGAAALGERGWRLARETLDARRLWRGGVEGLGV